MKKSLFLVFVFLFSFACETVAETIPATSGPDIKPGAIKLASGYLPGQYFSSASAACSALGASLGKSIPYIANTDYCRDSNWNQYYFFADCVGRWGAGYSPIGGWENSQCQKAGIVYSCPANQGWTLSGTSCSRPDCPSGYDRNASGQCVKDCTGKSGQSLPSSSYEFENNGGVTSVGGCHVNCSTWRSSGGGLIPLVHTGENCKYTGTSGDPENEANGTGFEPKPKEPTKRSDCTGSGQGYIESSSGSITCVPNEQAPDGQQAKTESKKPPAQSGNDANKDGQIDNDSSKVTVDESTVNDGKGSTTTTKTETKPGAVDANGNTVCPEGYTASGGNCTKTTITKESTGDYCTKNPTSPTCKGTEESDACKNNPDRVGCVDLGTVSEEGGLSTVEKGITSITVASVPSLNSCPADVNLLGKATLSFSPICQFGEMASPIVIALAWLTAGFIVLGFSRSNSNG